MEPAETCILCGEADQRRHLGLWLSKEGRATVHLECWLGAYDAERTANERAEGARLSVRTAW
jgi:hypothetical protein